MNEFRRDRVPTSCIPDWEAQYQPQQWEDYSCSPYITPVAGKHCIMHYGRLVRPVLVLGVFSELIVVQYNTPRATCDGLVCEEAIHRHRASFIEIPAASTEVATTTDTDTDVE